MLPMLVVLALGAALSCTAIAVVAGRLRRRTLTVRTVPVAPRAVSMRLGPLPAEAGLDRSGHPGVR